jgi:hypothetical protein
MKKIIISLPLMAALLVPVSLLAQDRDRDHDDHHDRRDGDRHDGHDQRYFDSRHKDYHEWNGSEDRAYHMYWEQRHRSYVDWDHASQRQRQDYWNWRHNHSDALLQINIR